MSGVSVDMGGAPSQVDLDFRAIYEGGENFLARAKALSDLRSQHDQSYAQLRLGNDAAAAFADAQRQRMDLARLVDEARERLEDAKQEAADIVAKANEEALGVARNAQSIAAALTKEAEQAKAAADEYAAKTRSEADAAMTSAADALASAQQREAQVLMSLNHLKERQKAADDAKAESDDSAARHKAKIDALHAALDAVKAV